MTPKEALRDATGNPVTYVFATLMLLVGAGGSIGGGAVVARQPVKIDGPIEVRVSGQDVMTAIARVEVRLDENSEKLGKISDSSDRIASALSKVETRIEVVAGTALGNEQDIKDIEDRVRMLERSMVPSEFGP